MRSFKRIVCILFCLIFMFCFTLPVFAEEETEVATESELITSFKNPNGRVLSVANLGDTRNYPENSLEGINSCISIGVDAVTVTVQLTKDNQLVLLSNTDLSINCATKADGTAVMGQVSEYSLDDLQAKFVLRAGHGGETSATGCVLTSLRDAITAANGKIILIVTNGATYAKEISALASELGAVDYVVLAGYDAASLTESALPVMSQFVDGTSSGTAAEAIDASINAEASVVQLNVFKEKTLNNADGKIRLLVDMSNEDACNGLQDRTAGWAKAIELGYSMIVTDYPANLVDYLTRVENARTTLSALIGEAESLDIKDYTKASRNALEDAVENAKTVSGEGSLSLDEADEACYELQEALDGLTISTGDESLMLPTWLVIIIVIAAIIVTIAVVVLVLRIVNKAKKSQKKLEKFKEKFNSDIPVVNDETLTTNIAEDEESNMGLLPENEVEASEEDNAETELATEPEQVLELENVEQAEPEQIESKIQIIDVIGNVDVEAESVVPEEDQ